MKKGLIRKLLGVVTLSWAAVDASYATSLVRSDVPAEPAWILHFDCDGLRPTALGQFLLSELDKPNTQAKFASFQSLFHFDFRTQLHGLTLYSQPGSPEDGVLVVYADFDADHLSNLAKSASDYQSSLHNGHVIHNWIDNGKRARQGTKPRTFAAIQGKRILFGQKEQAIAEALDVMDGKQANLGDTKTYRQFAARGEAAFIEAAARRFDVGDTYPQAAISKLAKLLRLQIGEKQEQLRAALSIDSSGDDTAGQIVSIGQGLLALLKLQSEKPELVKLSDSLNLKQEGSTVVVRLALPVQQAIEMLQADSARKARKKAETKKAAK